MVGIFFGFFLLRQKKLKQKYKYKNTNLIKLKNFYTAKETINKTKRQLTEWEKIFANNMDKELISKTYNQFIQLIMEKRIK